MIKVPLFTASKEIVQITTELVMEYTIILSLNSQESIQQICIQTLLEKSHTFPGCVQEVSASMKLCVAFTVCKVVSLSQKYPAYLLTCVLTLRCLLGVLPLVPQREIIHQQVTAYKSESWPGSSHHAMCGGRMSRAIAAELLHQLIDRAEKLFCGWGMSCHSAISLIPHKFPLKLHISACSNPHQYCLSSKSAGVHSFPQVVKKKFQITRLKFHTKVVFSGPL